MKTHSSRMFAAVGLVAFLGLYGCNEDSSAPDGGGKTVASAPSEANRWEASYTPTPAAQSGAGAQASSDMNSSTAAGQAQTAAQRSETSTTDAGADDERVKETSGADFDGNANHQDSNQAPPVVVPPPAGQKDVAYTAAPPKRPLDDPQAAPPSPEAVSCAAVLNGRGQAADGCGEHARLSLTWGGIKAGLSQQFGSVEGWIVNIMVTLLATLIGYVASGGWALLVKILTTLVKWSSVIVLLAQAKAFYDAFMEWKNAQAGSEEWADGIWGMSRSGTIIAVIAGLFTAGRYGKAKLAAPPEQAQLPFPKAGAIKVS